VPRSFENLVPSPGDEEGLLVAIVGGHAPISEAMPGVKQLLMSVAKGDLPTISGASDKPILMTTKDGGFGGRGEDMSSGAGPARPAPRVVCP
jgi:hypothetical protein